MNKFSFRLFLLLKIPIAYLAGLKLSHINDNEASIDVKHKWMNQNPFRSMYFAVQAMAAEISTGLLVFRHIDAKKANVSMLVTNQQAQFTKKATGKINFHCQNGIDIEKTIEKALNSGEGQVVWANSIGTDQTGDVVSSFKFEWSIKKRS